MAATLLLWLCLRNPKGAEVGHGWGKAVWGAMVALALCTPAYAASQPRGGGHATKLDSALASQGASDHRSAVIVTMKPGTKPGVRRRLEAQGGKVHKEHHIIDALTVKVDSRGLAALAADPDVLHISTDAVVAANAAAETSDTSIVSDLKKALGLGNWFPASNITIAVIDSGIAATDDFSGRIIGSYDFTNGAGGVSTAAQDAYGHGTHVAGLVGSSGAMSSGKYAGVASGVKLLSLRVLDANGGGRTSDVIAALQFAVANKDRFGIRIINLSLGHPIYESATSDPLVQSVEAAVRAGIVVVVAAGNYGTNGATGVTGYAGIASPVNSPSAITVGASSTAGTIERADDRVADYSSRGPSWLDGYAKPDVVAPGHSVMSDGVEGSTLSRLYPSLVFPAKNGKLMKLSGSSMATGVVSGLIAVMIETHDWAAHQRWQNTSSKGKGKKAVYVPPPALTPNAIKAMLQYSATPLRNADGIRYDALTQGAGEVDGLGAVTLAYMADTSRAAGAAWMTSVNPATRFGAEVEPWSQQILWGTRAISGSSLIEVNQSAWAANVVWGAGELDNIVWGTMSLESDNIVWGTSLMLNNVSWFGVVQEADNIVWGTALLGWAPNIVWGGGALLCTREGDNIVWGTMSLERDNIVWGTMLEFDNIVWGTLEFDNIVWGTANRVLGMAGGVQ
jgi:serine protease AprX